MKIFRKTLGIALHEKLRESSSSVLPVAALILLTRMTPYVSLTLKEVCVFLISTVFLILGIAMFNLGADMAMTPMGEHIGTGLSKSNKLLVLLLVSFLMGVFITIAEPDLSVLAEQVSGVMNGKILVITIGLGVGFFLLLGVMKIVFQKATGTIEWE